MTFNNAVDANSTGVQTLSSAGVWSGSALTQYSTLTGGASNAIVSLGVATNGQLVVGSTGTTPVLATLTSSGGTVGITNGAGSINLEVSAEGLSWSEVDGAVGAPAVEQGYSFITGAGSITLPTSPALGSTIVIQCNVASAVTITAGGTNIIRLGATASSGGGTCTSTGIGNALTLTYSTTNTVWIARGVQGNWTLA